MTGNLTRGQTQRRVEVLKFPTGMEAVDSIAVDATHVPTPSSPDINPFVLPEGTPMSLSASNATATTANVKQMMPWNGSAGTKIEGILVAPVYLGAQATQGANHGAIYFWNAIFSTAAIVGFTINPAKFATDLPSCAFR